ncbi:MAG: glycosyltransferase [Thermoplasmata archaeon]|nr:glycosyltransferase [Thermoplasmata archaeon]
MRILRIDSWDGTPGGAQDYVREITAELAQRGHQTQVVQITDGTPPIGPPVGSHVVAATGRATRLRQDVLQDAPLAARLRAQIEEFSPDLISLHHFDARYATIARVLGDQSIPLVMAAHDAELVCPISTLVRPGNVICEGGVRVRCLFTGCHVGLGGPYNLLQTRSFDRTLRGKMRAYLCPSRSLTDYLDSNGYRPALHLPSFARIPEPVRRAAPPLPAAGTPPTVGFIGRLDWYKGLQDLVPAFAILRKSVPDARLDIAGDGPSRPGLEALAARLGVDGSVQFRGRLIGPEKEAWFQNVHVLAVPSNMWENFPLVALEGLVRGRPVVATQIGGIPDIVDEGETGYLVPIGGPTQLAARLSELLRDSALASKMGELGRARVLERFTPEKHVERLLAVYDAVLRGEPLVSRSPAAGLVPAGSAGRSAATA